jgi:triacylglycerol lipase
MIPKGSIPRQGVLSVLAAVLCLTGASVAGPASALPAAPPDRAAPAGIDFASPAEQSPPGANDWACRPSGRHPTPVVLVHGLGANMYWNWQTMAPLLAGRGYCVFALTYGVDPRAPFPLDQFGGVVPMERSAGELAAFIDEVLARTGARQVDIVGHSEGSLMPNYYLKFMGGAARVARYVALTPLWDGTEFYGAGTMYELGKPSGLSPQVAGLFAQLCGSCPQFIRGSPFLEEMNRGGPAVPGVTYTMIMTRYDELVVPYTSGVLEGATNIVVQDVCPADVSEHGGLAFDPVAQQLVLNALDPAGAQPPPCPGVAHSAPLSPAGHRS